MPRAKKPSATFTLSEFDKLSAAITDLLQRTHAALAASESSRQLAERLEHAGFFVASTRAPTAAPAPKANGGAKRTGAARPTRRRHHSPIEPSKVVAVIKAAGAAGATAGAIATKLGVDAERLRHHLYQLRDVGTLKMIGKAGAAKYIAAKGAASGGKRGKRGKAAAPRNGGAKKDNAEKPAVAGTLTETSAS
jgi:hypothetical protein